MTLEHTVARGEIAYAYESPRPDVQALVPLSVTRVLDLGCSSGALGEALKARQGAEVVGVELDGAYARDAATRLDRVVNADIEQLFSDPTAVADLGRFDCLIAADVLEHLVDPWSVLREASGLLASGGVAVISLPNIRFWQTFWQLGWRGRWPRRSVGIFDRTHLRFFTESDALELLSQAGLDAVKINRMYRFRSERATRYDRYVALLGRGPLRPFFAFQYVILASRR